VTRPGTAALLVGMMAMGGASASWGQVAAQATPEQAAAEAEFAQQRAAIEQKMNFASQVLFQATGARRVAASDNQEAKAALNEARELFTKARAAIDARNLVAANDLVSESLRLVARAVQQVPDQGQEVQEQRLRFTHRLQDLQTFQASHLLSMRRVSEVPTGATRPAELEQVRELMAQAQTFADGGKYGDAQQTLARAAEVITTSAPKLMAGRAADYDIKFSSASEAFEFENARFHSYEDLVPVAVGYLKPPQARLEEIRKAVDEGRRIHEQSRELAVKGEFEGAARLSEQATAQMRKALKTAGVALQE
jgi:hypothetical protein